MVRKRLLRPERLRAVPSQFSWLDHRLVRERHLDRCSTEALTLYLFLAAVADAQDLSYYSDASLRSRMGFSQAQLDAARRRLIDVDLIAVQAPLVQVLSLDRPSTDERPVTRRNPHFEFPGHAKALIDQRNSASRRQRSRNRFLKMVVGSSVSVKL